MKKKKFKPVITQVRLNPEQAVLSCCRIVANFKAGGGFNCDQPNGIFGCGGLGGPYNFSQSS